LDRGQEIEEDEACDDAEEDAVANIAKDIESDQQAQHMECSTFLWQCPGISDPLLWWKQKQFLLLILSCLAQKYLCIPATEAPSEWIFGTASCLLRKFRNWMESELAGRMVFIKKNFDWYEAFLQKKASEEDWSGIELGQKWNRVGTLPVWKGKVKAMGNIYMLWNSVR
jgi:hypothetical protein